LPKPPVIVTPEVGLASVAAPRQMVEQLEALQVKTAREDG
jgi:hypothetical protein